MNINQYKIGKAVIEIRSPFELQNEPPFSDYLCENEIADYIVNFEISDEIVCEVEKISYESRRYVMIKKEEKSFFYYKDIDGGRNGYYACRIAEENQHSCKILVKPYFAENFYQAILFETIGLEEIFAQSNQSIFHSSYLNVDGQAILFTGPCEIGKSTQADLWAKYRNVEIVNGDKSVLYVKDGVAMAGALPFSGSSSFCVKKDLPIKAIVILSKKLFNAAKRLEGIESFLAVYKSCYPVEYSQKLMNSQINLAQDICKNTAVYKFGCLPDKTAVEYLERFINGS